MAETKKDIADTPWGDGEGNISARAWDQLEDQGIITLSQAEEYSGERRRRLVGHIKRGDFKAERRIGPFGVGFWAIDKADFERWLEERESARQAS